MTLPAGENRLLSYKTNVDVDILAIKKNDRNAFGFCV